MQARFTTRLSLRIPLIIGLFGCCVALLIGVIVPRQIESFVERGFERDALTNVSQIKVLRSYYTQTVISVIQENDSLSPHYDHWQDPSRIPLPATMVHELSDRISGAGREVHLTSQYPFPHRASRQLDGFQNQAWQVLTADPAHFFSRLEEGEAGRFLRVAVADVMTEQACVDCHNAHPESPKTDWALGDVRGILEIRLDITDGLIEARNLGLLVTAILILATLAASIGLSLYLRRSTFIPIEAMSDAARTYAEGDTAASVSGIERGDEIGVLARSLDVFRAQADQINVLNAERAAYLSQLETLVDERTADLQQSAQDLSKAYGTIRESIDYASAIQRSILPDLAHLPSAIRDHFALWEPRDVVGGDIYWCRSWSGGYLIAVADGTGHGVPGAFVTLLASGAFDKALGASMDGDLKGLVARFHIVLQETLGQHRAGGESDDGLELAACFIAPDRSRLFFVGAHLNLYIAEAGSVSMIRGDRAGIGYRDTPVDQNYTLHEVPLTPGQRFYLTSDGYIDQIGGARGVGFGKTRFQKLLADIQSLPMLDQGEAIRQNLIEFQSDQRRRDDVTVFGFEFSPPTDST